MRELCVAPEQPTSLPEFLKAPAQAIAISAPATASNDISEDEEAVPIEVGDNAELMREFTEEAQEHLHRIELDALAPRGESVPTPTR